MTGVTEFESAQVDVTAVCTAAVAVRGTAFWKIGDSDLLTLARSVEHAARLLYTAQVHLAGEVSTRNLHTTRGATSAAALLRHTLTISAPDARARVAAARAILPQDLPTGGETEPQLPLLGDALADGLIGPEETRTIVTTMRTLPAGVDTETRQLCQKLLVEHGQVTEPAPFAEFARSVAVTCDPDGKLDGRDPTDRVELTLGARNAATGLSRFHGQLDDQGVELLSQAIDGLAAPQPTVAGGPDPRSAATRRGQALKEVLRRYLDLGDAPIQGGERPHITITVDFEDLKRRIGAAYLVHGGPVTAAQARMLACDANIIPMVLGSASQVLDVGRSSRSFPTAIRRAITQRDKGCTWPGCDRPAGWTDCHHVRHWLDDGPSAYRNGVLLCRRHHTEIHFGHWEIVFAPDGTPDFIPPVWVDPDRTPRRNTSHHLTQILRT